MEARRHLLATIGAAMARPIDPADSQVSDAPTQYVADVVRRAGYDASCSRVRSDHASMWSSYETDVLREMRAFIDGLPPSP
jgi:hypothetical protein